MIDKMIAEWYGHDMSMNCHCEPKAYAICNECEDEDDECWKCDGTGEHIVALESDADFILHNGILGDRSFTVTYWLETGQVDFNTIGVEANG